LFRRGGTRGRLALGAATLLQALRLGPVGSGFMCPATFSATYLAPSLLAARAGGLALVFGMTMFAGVLELALAPFLNRLRANTSTPAVGLAAATGIASRKVAFAVATIFILMGFVPKLPELLGLMPRPVVVAALLFAVSFVMINGLQIMTSRLLDARRTVIIALSVIAGIAVEVFPSISISAPPVLLPLVGSSLVLATAFALGLNLLFRIGVRKTATLRIEDTAPDLDRVEAFFHTQGAKWGARPDVITRATYGTIQLIDAIAEEYRREGPIVVAAIFDEFNLDVLVSYTGGQLVFPDVRPSPAQIRESTDGAQLLAG
jgi:xanthine permease XanP